MKIKKIKSYLVKYPSLGFLALFGCPKDDVKLGGVVVAPEELNTIKLNRIASNSLSYTLVIKGFSEQSKEKLENADLSSIDALVGNLQEKDLNLTAKAIIEELIGDSLFSLEILIYQPKVRLTGEAMPPDF